MKKIKYIITIILLSGICFLLVITPSYREKYKNEIAIEIHEEKPYELSNEFYMNEDKDNIQIMVLKGNLSKKELKKYNLK